ncbi:MAG: AAA family ATPase [Deltaproteobacteria bacterium]|nr:AAA family ATPase [Deltaproteobacteria bacterium]
MAGFIISVIGGKGGVGKSVYAANFALAAMQELKIRPLIVDLDLQSLGDQNIILGQNPIKHIVDITKLQGIPFDIKNLAPYIVNTSSGYNYISAPRDSIIAKDIDIDGLGKFLKAVPQLFPLIVIDCGSQMDPHVMKTLEFSTLIFVVTTADVIVINQTKRILSKIQELLFPPDMVQLIINRYSPSQVIHPQVLQKNIGKNVFGNSFSKSDKCQLNHLKQ